jgi:hypothetical protein
MPLTRKVERIHAAHRAAQVASPLGVAVMDGQPNSAREPVRLDGRVTYQP